MQPTQSQQPNTTEAKPIQVGTEPGEIERLSQEISQTGVANSEEDVERLATEGRDTGGDDAPAIPTPIITSS